MLLASLAFLSIAILTQSASASGDLCEPTTVNPIVNFTLHPPNSRSQIFGGDVVRVRYSVYLLRNVSSATPPQQEILIVAISEDVNVLQVLESGKVLTERLLNTTEDGFEEKLNESSQSNATSSLPSQISAEDCLYDLFTDYITVKGDLLGKSNLTLLINVSSSMNVFDNFTESYNASLRIIVLKKSGLLEIIFRPIVLVFIGLITFSMGTALNPVTILTYLRRPIAPAIGFGCQYLLMPLIAFSIAMIIPMDKAFGFGLVTTGCSPGGGGSNIWTVLLKGDLNLSMVMTFLSSIAAMGMMPLWLFLLKGYFLESSVKIPYESIARDLLMVVVPVLIGMFVSWKFPKASSVVRRLTKPLAIALIIILLPFGIYVNLHIFRLYYRMPHILAIAVLLPWLGFLAGAVVACLLRMKRAQIVAISLETGIQNIGIPIVILMYSLPQPEGSIGAAMPLAVGFFTPLPLYLLLAGIKIYERINGPGTTKVISVEEAAEIKEQQIGLAESNQCDKKEGCAHETDPNDQM